MVRVVFLIVVSSLFFVVSCDDKKKSSGNLMKDWNKIKSEILKCEKLECIKKTMLGSLEDVAVITQNFYNHKRDEYIKDIQFDIKYSYIVEKYFMGVSKDYENTNENSQQKNCSEENIKKDIKSSGDWENLKKSISEKYEEDFEIVIEECLSLLKELIYFNDNDFDVSYKTIMESYNFIENLKQTFYKNKTESFLDLAFDRLYNSNLCNNSIPGQNDFINNATCSYSKQVSWALFISCNKTDFKDRTFSRIALLNFESQTIVCSIPFNQTINNENGFTENGFTVIFADNCQESLTQVQYHVAIIDDSLGINFSSKTIFYNITIDNQNKMDNYPLYKDRYIILPDNLTNLISTSSFIIYSLDHKQFQTIQGNNFTLQENFDDLRIVIYENENQTIKFACEHCIYLAHNYSLSDDWENFLTNVTFSELDLNNLTNSLKEKLNNAPIVDVIQKFYTNKMNSYKTIFNNDIETNLNKEIEQIINKQLKIMLYQQNKDSCENNNILNECSTELTEILFNKYKNIYKIFQEEGKSLIKSKIYTVDSTFEDTFKSIISNQTFFNATINIFHSKLKRVINEIILNNSNLTSKIKTSCDDLYLNSIHKNYSSNSTDCFKFLKTEIVQWAVTLSLEIKEENPQCGLSSETMFFLTTLDDPTDLGTLDDNKVICKIGMKKVKVNGNILYINFKQGSCEHFPYPNIDTYYLGMYAQDKTTGIYSKIIVYPNTSIKYYDYFPINSTKILNYSVKAGKCTIPRDIQLKDENLSDKYIEYSFDANDFAFEKKEPIHNLGNQIKDNLSLIIYDEEGKIIFAAKGCEYKGKFELNDCHKEHTESYIDSGTFTTCICKEGFYGDKCENEVTNSSPSGFNEQLYDILSDGNFIVDVNKHSATVNTQKLNTLKNLIEMTNQLRKENSTSTSTEAINITQINTLNSITENYLTNSKPDTTSIYLLTLAINANLIKLKQKRSSKLRQLEDINEPEAMITHKIEHLLHLATIHYSTMNIDDQKESILTLIPNNIYVHQWTCHSYQKAYDTTNKYHLTYIDPDIICEDDKSNPTYTVIELPRNITKDIYANQTASNIVSFYIRSPSDKEYANVKLSIPTSGMYIQSNITDNNNHIVEVYSAESPFFTDKCYRGDFDFDITERVKVDLLDGFKVMKSISNGCYPSHFNPSTERATLTCYSDMDLMVGFTIGDYGNLTETGSIFECSTDIKDIEKNIAFWLYLLILLISICLIIFYLVIKYGNESKDELLKIETALENDGMVRDVDQPQPINVMSETGKKSERDEVVGNVADPNKINVELNENTFVKMFIKNLFELHPLITTVTPSVITPLSMRIAFFAFNFLTLCGFNAVFFTNDYLFERYKHKDRDKFVYSIRDEFGKMISAIVCTMAVSVLMRLIIIVTLEKKKEVEKKIKENIEHIHVVKEFRKDMLLNRCICVFVMMIITAWFFYFSIAWCNRYPKAQHSWGHACAWSIMFNYILFSTVYIVIITAVQMKDSCENCTYYMKRTFMF